MLDELPLEDQYVFTTLRYDGSVKRSSNTQLNCLENKTAYLIKYHYDRLVLAAERMGYYHALKTIKSPNDLLARVQTAVENHKRKTGTKCPYRVRVSLWSGGTSNIEVSPIMAKREPLLYPTTLDINRQHHEAASRNGVYKVVLDVVPSKTTSHTSNKTYYRTTYDYSRACAGIQSYQDAKEVLLYNRDNDIIDGSITTPYFYRDGKWVTPHANCGGQQGTTRRWALDQNLCVTGTVDIASLRHNEVVWLSNGVKGFFTARFVACDRRPRGAPCYESRSNSSESASSSTSTPATSSCSSSEVHPEEEYDEACEVGLRKHPVQPGGEAFRNEAFALDVFGSKSEGVDSKPPDDLNHKALDAFDSKLKL